MAVKSPCIDICVFDGKTGFCVGCLRTAPEAKDWKKLTDYRRHQIINDCTRRGQKFRREAENRITKEKYE